MGIFTQHYSAPLIGTVAAIFLGWLVTRMGHAVIGSRIKEPTERYRYHKALTTVVIIAVVFAVVALWAHLAQHAGTFAGLVGAGVAVALREPLLSIAGRIAIFAGKIFNVGDRIEINQMKGDVIDIGFFYTRMMEVGNWIGGDQASGRIVQISNSKIFGAPVFNYTQNFGYIWDEIELPITYSSNAAQASAILLEVGRNYTKEFLTGARAALERMQRYFVVPKFELDPVVYIEITSNWVSLRMRYVVDPKERRNATNFIWREVFERIQKRKDITIGSTTIDLTVRPAEQKQAEHPGQKKAA